LGVVTAVGSLAMFGAFAVFTDTQNVPNNSFSVGTLDISASPTTALVTFTGMAPGDEVTRPITVTNAGSLELVLATFGARLVGCQPYAVYGGSMGSTGSLGSVALIENVPARFLKVGDVVVFQPPASGEPPSPLMDRIISIDEVDGQQAPCPASSMSLSMRACQTRATASTQTTW
jgi:hypothetical protein